jgi:Protein of unknown function (DUF1559)
MLSFFSSLRAPTGRFVVLGLVLLCGPRFALAQPSAEEPLLSAIAPKECLVYTSWAGRAKPDPNSNNRTEKLLAEPEVQAFMKQLSTRLSKVPMLAMGDETRLKRAAAEAIAPQIVSAISSKAGAFFVESVKLLPDAKAEVSAAALINFGDGVDELLESAMGIMQTEAQDFTPTMIGGDKFYTRQLDAPLVGSFYVGTSRGYLIAALGKAVAEKTVSTINLEPGRGGAEPKWLAQLKTKMKIERRGSIGYVNVPACLALVPQVAGEDAQQAMHLMQLLGLDEVAAFESASGFDGEGMLDRLSIVMKGPPRGLLKLLTQPISKTSLEKLPSDTLFAVACSLDLNAALDEFLAVMQVLSPSDAENIERGLEQSTIQLGFDVREQLIAQLGPTWTLYNGAGDGLGFGTVLKADVKDESQLNDAFVELVGLMRGRGANDPRAPRIERNRYKDSTIYSFVSTELPFQPSWAIADGELLVTLFPQTLKPIISGFPADKRLDVARYVTDEAPICSFSYLDVQRQYELIYNYAAVMFGAFPMMMSDAPGGAEIATLVNGLELPSCRCVHRHLTPAVSLLTRTADGIDLTTRQTMPSVNVSVMAPVAVGLLLPAVQAARAAARRMQSSNNLKQLALANLNYESAFKRFPAAFSTDEAGKPLLSWRVQILPFIEQNDLYQQFHLDEPWDSEHNLKLLEKMPQVFRSPESRAPVGNTVYLGIGGKQGVIRAFDKSNPRSPRGVRFGDMVDGSSNTIMVIETSDKFAVEWTKPVEFAPNLTSLLAYLVCTLVAQMRFSVTVRCNF